MVVVAVAVAPVAVAEAVAARHLVGQLFDLEALELGVVAGVADADRLLDDVERERERGELPEVGPCRGG